jgi:hypothetical protein
LDTAETVTLKLQEQVSGAADKSMGALARLEAQILREQAALGRLTDSLGVARGKLAALAEGAADPRAVAAFEKQGAAVLKLQASLAEAKDTLAIMGQAKVEPKDLEKAHADVAALVTELEAARGKMAEMQGAASAKVVNLDAYRKQAGAVASMADRIEGQKDKISGLGEKLSEGSKAADGAKVPLAAVAKTAKMLGGEFGASEAKGVKLLGLFLKMGPTIGIVVAGVLILTGGLAALGGIISKGISESGKMRDELLQLSTAGVTLWNSLRATTSAGTQLQDMVTRVSSGSALARDKIAEYATQLRNARFTGKQLETALTAMSTAGAAGGDAMATQFLASAQAARYFQGDVDKLADRVEKKFGAVAQKKLLSLDVQLSKLHENISYIFSGADIEPFLRGLQTIFSLFGKNTDGAKSMRDMVTKVTEMAIGGFLRLAIALVKTYIWIKTHETAWKSVKVVAMVALIAIGLAIGAVVLVLGVLAVAAASLMFTLALPFILAAAAIYGFIKLVKSFNLVDMGKALVMGLVNGIKAAGTAVYSALKGVVNDAVTGVTKFLEIGSPSKLMAREIGHPMGTGIAEGHDDAAGDVKDSAQKMAAGGVQGAKGGAVGAGSSGGGVHLEFNNCSFGGGLTEDIMRLWLTRILEGELTAGEGTT